ncbi:hypothetical protein [Ensifer adhaerens]
MKFLTEEAAPFVIGEMLKAAPLAKLAVAFWGADAVERLGIGRDSSKTKIICNLESGACNPFEIRKLRAMAPRVEVLTNARLHAKVYWTANSAVVGSSNASTNGLAVEGRVLESWAEGNVLVNDSSVLAEMSSWFDQLFEDSLEITEPDLLKAEEIWRKRRLVSPPGVSVKKGLLETFRKTSEHPLWWRTKVSYWLDHATSRAEADFAAVRNELSLGEDFSFYENWQEYLSEDDWVLDFFMEKPSVAKFNDIWRILPSSAQAPTLSLARKSQDFSPDAFGIVAVSKSDKDQLASAAKHFLASHKTSDKRNAIVSLPEVVTYLDRLAEDDKPSLLHFEAAMRNIYFEAKKAGYTAHAYWKMLQNDGAMNTARRLALAPQASEGFGKLFLMGKLDLTVEALIVREPWRRLFEAEVIASAQKRLDQMAGSTSR